MLFYFFESSNKMSVPAVAVTRFELALFLFIRFKMCAGQLRLLSIVKFWIFDLIAAYFNILSSSFFFVFGIFTVRIKFFDSKRYIENVGCFLTKLTLKHVSLGRDLDLIPNQSKLSTMTIKSNLQIIVKTLNCLPEDYNRKI